MPAFEGPQRPPPGDRESRVRRLEDLILLAQLKVDLDEAGLALRLARDYEHDPSSLSDLDFIKLAKKLEDGRGTVSGELSERVLSRAEASSIDERLKADARALSVLAQGQRPRDEDVPMSPLHLSLSRLHVPLTLEVLSPDAAAEEASPAEPLRLPNSTALRRSGRGARNQTSARSMRLTSFVAELQTDGAKVGEAARAVWSRLNGRRPDELEVSRESDANALTRLARETAMLSSQVALAVTKAQAVSTVLEHQGRRALPLDSLSPAAGALDRLRAQLSINSLSLHLDRVYATLEAELLGSLEGNADGSHGHGSEGMVAGLKPTQFEPLVRDFERCERKVFRVEEALAREERTPRLREQADAAESGDGDTGADAPCTITDAAAMGDVPDECRDGPPATAAGGAGGWDDGAAAELAEVERDVLALLSRIGLPALAMADEAPAVNLGRIREQASGVLARARRGVAFYVRGCRVVWQDLLLAAQLIGRAVRGYTLQKREVRAVRRTAKDLVMLVPFTILLLIPMSPLGHLLLFSFIQRTIPGFFPSAFTDQRQGMLDMYSSITQAPKGKDGAAADAPAVAPAAGQA